MFLSHDSGDKELIVRKIAWELRIPYFLDEKHIRHGEVIPERISQGISRCSLLVFFVTRNSLNNLGKERSYCLQELQAAHDRTLLFFWDCANDRAASDEEFQFQIGELVKAQAQNRVLFGGTVLSNRKHLRASDYDCQFKAIARALERVAWRTKIPRLIPVGGLVASALFLVIELFRQPQVTWYTRWDQKFSSRGYEGTAYTWVNVTLNWIPGPDARVTWKVGDNSQWTCTAKELKDYQSLASLRAPGNPNFYVIKESLKPIPWNEIPRESNPELLFLQWVVNEVNLGRKAGKSILDSRWDDHETQLGAFFREKFPERNFEADLKNWRTSAQGDQEIVAAESILEALVKSRIVESLSHHNYSVQIGWRSFHVRRPTDSVLHATIK